MNANLNAQLLVSCRCGKVQFATTGAPIITAACYCTSCQTAGQQFEKLSPSVPVLDRDGATGFVLYRKDRLRCTAGDQLLREYRLKPESPTRRVLATCCNSTMFLEFSKGHWLSLYRDRFENAAPPIETRTMTKDRRPGVTFSDDIPSPASHTATFMWKLLVAWAAMGFRAPQVPFGNAAK
jgi:hypothetical protein